MMAVNEKKQMITRLFRCEICDNVTMHTVPLVPEGYMHCKALMFKSITIAENYRHLEPAECGGRLKIIDVGSLGALESGL